MFAIPGLLSMSMVMVSHLCYFLPYEESGSLPGFIVCMYFVSLVGNSGACSDTVSKQVRISEASIFRDLLLVQLAA